MVAVVIRQQKQLRGGNSNSALPQATSQCPVGGYFPITAFRVPRFKCVARLLR